MMVLAGGALVSRRLTGKLDDVHGALVDERLERAIHCRDPQAANFLSRFGKYFVRRQRPSEPFEHSGNRGALSGVSFHAGERVFGCTLRESYH